MTPTVPALAGSALGLAAGAGLNSYAVLLVYGFLARFFPDQYPGTLGQILASTPALATCGTLFLLEFFADKIPGLDHVWDVVHTIVRPLAGAFLAIAVVQPHVDTAGAVVAGGAGGGVSLVTHLVKSATRLTSTALTAGVANAALSLAEDVVAFLQALVALFLPLVALVVVVAIAVIFLVTVPRLASRMDLLGRRRGKPKADPPPAPAPG